MKFGFRTPSLGKSISARTTGHLNRSIKKMINPAYGKKGMGILHPQKAAYNAIYNKTTSSIVPKVSKGKSQPISKSIKTKYNDDYVLSLFSKLPERVGKHTKTAIELVESTRLLRNQTNGDVDYDEDPAITLNNAMKLDAEAQAFDAGYPLYMQAKTAYTSGNYDQTVILGRQALAVGYTNANVYERIAMGYRKLKQYDNEIAILQEGLKVNSKDDYSSETVKSNFEYRISRASQLNKK